MDAESLEMSDLFLWVVDLDEGPASVDIRIKILYTVCFCDIRSKGALIRILGPITDCQSLK